MDFLNRVSTQIKEFLTGLSAGRKMALGVTGGAIFLFIGGMLYWAGQQNYQPITHGNMSAEDSANVMRLLREKKIPFQVDPTGKLVTVPSEYLNDLRLELAMQGMPQSIGTGYELFDKQTFGTTSLVNKINQKRALEGELMRSINTIKGVKRSRIHLALPEKSAFVQDQKKVTASVVLDLENGVQLNDKQIFGIGHLISSAVEGLDPNDVAILDSFGKELSKNSHDSLVALTSEQSDYKRKLEEEYQRKVEDVLTKVVGEGRVKASITADLDFSNVQESQTILDQDGATIKSSQKIAENMEGTRPVASGPAGATSNTPGEQPGVVTPNAVKNNTNKSNEIVNYDIPKTIRTTSRPVGSLKKLSVAVLIDGKTIKTTGADGKTETKNEQWSAERVKEFEALVAGALAIDKKRGDTLEIRNMEFAHADFDEAEKILDASIWKAYLQQIILYSVICLVIVLFFFFVVRPYIRWITENTTESVDTFLPQTIEDFIILKKMKGSDLVGLEYSPLFDYFANKRSESAFRVIHSDHVTTESGTGVVHMAPAYGEEDFNGCKKAGIPVVNPVDDDGMFTAAVKDFEGRRVKDADKDIIAKLKSESRLFKQDTLVHSYPFCYRSGTPLIYRAVSSWFVAVEKIKEEIIAANKTTHWVPETLRDGRFGNWLEGARDWAISRNRFWGTPLPIWKNKEGEIICVGSKAELEKLSGKKVDDLHKEFVDQIEIPSPTGKSPLKRIDEVLDCWFESGSMPYAQWGYPFTHQEDFEKNFPADFIAEGLDQTRGWFYTLMVIGAGLFGKSPFKNVIVNGLILAEDGKKMSKSLKNYPDPEKVLNEHGADALRLYMIDSQAVRAEELRFSDKGVREIVRRISLRWWNSYSFFTNYASIDGFKPRGDYGNTPNLLDQWILSRLNSLIQKTNEEMAAYRLYTVVPELLNFIEALTNTYIRFNRPHFWRDGMPEDKRFAYETLYHVLITLSKVMAPFAPFLSEETYRNLSQASSTRKESVHLESFPEAETQFIKPDLEDAVARMDALVMLGRNLREKIKIKAKIPLLTMKIIHRDQKVLSSLQKLEAYFQDELNIRKFEYHTKEEDFILVKAKANFPVLGKRVGPKMKLIAAQIDKLSLADLESLEKGATMTIEGESISIADVEIRRQSLGDKITIAAHQLISIEVDPTLTEEQILEGLSREVMRKIQQARKNADLKLDARIELTLFVDGKLLEAVKAHQSTLMSETLTTKLNFAASLDSLQGNHTEVATDIEEGKVGIGISVVG